MSRYIDRDAVRRAIQEYCGIQEKITPDGIAKVVMSVPTVDAVEVKHGHWIEHTEKPDWLEDDVEVFYNCSECGTSHWSIEPPYCPGCGAKMDGGRSEPQ